MKITNTNQFLASAFRTDVIGREMWNGKNNEGKSKLIEEHDYYVRPDKVIGGCSVQMPQFAWDPPCLGLPGTWAYGHHTDLEDVLKILVSDVTSSDEIELEFIATRNNWTPAFLTTYYRSTVDESYPFGGVLTIKEKKCINANNTFVSECKFINDCNAVRRYRVEMQLPHFARQSEENVYLVHAKALPGGMLYGNDKFLIDGYAVATTNFGKTIFELELAPHETKAVRFSFAVSEQSAVCADEYVNAALKDIDIFQKNEQLFNDWMHTNVPSLEIDDFDLLKIYFYRWFLVYRSQHNPRSILKQHPYKHPAFYESPFGLWFGCAVGLPVPCQILESRWLTNKKLSCGHVLNWGARTRGYMNYLQFTPMAIWKWYLSHRDKKVLLSIYQTAKEYALKDIDMNNLEKLPVQHGSWTTGAEYQPNFYQFTQPDQWDWRCDEEGSAKLNMPKASLIRPDLCAHTIANLLATADIARVLGLSEDAKLFAEIALRQSDSVVKKLWCEETGCFVGADPLSEAQADEALCYDSFMPYLWGMMNNNRCVDAFAKIFDERLFWDEFPVATAAKNNLMYWSGNCLIGPTQASVNNPHIYPCSWNGPSWHYANGLLVAALGSVVENNNNDKLREKWLLLFERWSDLHFLYGDRSTPCAIEHHRPSDGARFRSIVDYFHSAWLDSLYSYYFGVRIEVDRLEFKPFFQGAFKLENITIGRVQFSFVQEVAADGRLIKTIILGGLVVAGSKTSEAARFVLPKEIYD
ncbi:MAG: hypothetical protein WCV63_00775 [Negativicutes bacterium]|jgi:hypothetical protein